MSWLVNRVMQVFWTNHRAKKSKKKINPGSLSTLTWELLYCITGVIASCTICSTAIIPSHVLNIPCTLCKLNYAYILISSYILSIEGQRQRWYHHYQFLTSLLYETNGFNVAVDLFSFSHKRHQIVVRTSDPLGCTFYSTFLFLQYFGVICNLFLNLRTAT